jgi:Domain of unknown function (DUF4136)
MTQTRSRALMLAPVLALLSLSACATPFRADVARFQQLPPAQGQSFTVQADDTRLAGGLEFAHYADLVAERLVAQGYSEATDPASAQLVVRLGYDIDSGREKVVSSGFSRPFYSSRIYSPFYSPFYGRGYARSAYRFGFYDPFLFGAGYDDVRSYTIYTSALRMTINRVGGERVFEGTAKAQSLSSKLTYLVPNLVSAMFEGFPGNSGEEIKVTIAPEKSAAK